MDNHLGWLAVVLLWLSVSTVHCRQKTDVKEVAREDFAEEPKNPSDRQAEVLILGAGVAGVTAARTLAKNDIHDFIIIEGMDTVGGRVRTESFAGYNVEMGASWIEGTKSATGGAPNPIYKLAKKNKVDYFLNDYDAWRVFNQTGSDVTDEADNIYLRMQKGFDFALDYRKTLLKDLHLSDMSMHNGMQYGGWEGRTPLENLLDFWEMDFDTGFPAEMSGLRYFYGSNKRPPYTDHELFVFGDKNSRGYTEVINGILAGIPDWEEKTHLNTMVDSIKYNKNGVVVSTSRGKYRAKYAIVTFSLGVLQQKAVTFSPPLPQWKQQAIFGFNMADYNNLYLKFPSVGDWFVDDSVEWYAYASERRGYFPAWQNLNKFIPGSRILFASIVYDEARRLADLSDNEIQAEAMAVLRTMFGPGIPDPEQMVMSRWSKSVCSYGAFPDWPTGYSLESFKNLQAPVGRLYFAGDAYHDDFGYTNGAHLSSIRETKKLVKCIKNGEC